MDSGFVSHSLYQMSASLNIHRAHLRRSSNWPRLLSSDRATAYYTCYFDSIKSGEMNKVGWQSWCRPTLDGKADARKLDRTGLALNSHNTRPGVGRNGALLC